MRTKRLLMITAMTFFIACNTSVKKDQDKDQQTSGDTVSAKEVIDSSNAAGKHSENLEENPTLTLNGGKKWTADQETKKKVKELQKIVTEFVNKKDQTLDQYIQLSQQIQQGANKIVSETKMNGLENESLHKWVHPLFQSINNLDGAATAKDAEVVVKQIKDQLDEFNKYFE